MKFHPRSHRLDYGIDRKSVKLHSGTLQHFNNGFRAVEAHKPCLLLAGGMLLDGFSKVKGLYVVVELAVRVDARVSAFVMLSPWGCWRFCLNEDVREQRVVPFASPSVLKLSVILGDIIGQGRIDTEAKYSHSRYSNGLRYLR